MGRVVIVVRVRLCVCVRVCLCASVRVREREGEREKEKERKKACICLTLYSYCLFIVCGYAVAAGCFDIGDGPSGRACGVRPFAMMCTDQVRCLSNYCGSNLPWVYFPLFEQMGHE